MKTIVKLHYSTRNKAALFRILETAASRGWSGLFRMFRQNKASRSKTSLDERPIALPIQLRMNKAKRGRLMPKRDRSPLEYFQELLTVNEVARWLKLKPSTIRAYAERGSLPCIRVGNRLRFLTSDVGSWIARRHEKGDQ